MVAKAVVVHFRVGLKHHPPDENRHHQNHQRKTEDAVNQIKEQIGEFDKGKQTQHDQSADQSHKAGLGNDNPSELKIRNSNAR